GEGAPIDRAGGVTGVGEGAVLELGRAVEDGVTGDDDVPEFDVCPDAPGGPGRDHQAAPRFVDDLSPQVLERHDLTVVGEVEARLEAEHFGPTDAAGIVEAEGVVVAAVAVIPPTVPEGAKGPVTFGMKSATLCV